MPIAAGFEDMSINPAPVIADKDSQLTGGVIQLDVNPLCLGVAECVDQSFPSDAVNIIAYNGPQWHGRPFHNHAKINSFLHSQLLGNAGKRILEILWILY